MRVFAILLFAFLLAPLFATGVGGNEHGVVVARVDGVVGRGTALYVADAVAEAESRGVPLVIELDTPGGLVDATLEIQRSLDGAEVPVLTYVGPGSAAFAASAGTFILLMGQPNGMADGSTIGSAQPIQAGPGGSGNASAKVTNFLVERVRSIAEQHGRDPDVAEQYITENLNQNVSAAIATGMVDVEASTLAGFLTAVDGMRAGVGDGTVVLRTDGAAIHRIEPGSVAKTVDLLGDPTLAFILLMAGMYSLIFGLANPGTYVPETIGAIFLILGLIGLGLFGLGTAGFLLILLGVIFFVAEVFTPTHGLLTVAGVACLILAFLFLFDAPLLPASFIRRVQGVGITLALLSGGVVMAVVMLALRTREKPPTHVDIGARGIAVGPLNMTGTVEVWGEVWNAVADIPIEDGAPVKVVSRDGLLLHVTLADEDE